MSVAVSGVSVAPFIPLSKLVHFIYPLIGAAGIVIFVGIIIKMFTDGSIPAAQEENRPCSRCKRRICLKSGRMPAWVSHFPEIVRRWETSW